MHNEGFSFYSLGFWGLDGVGTCSLDAAFLSATVRSRPQPLATVRNRSQPFATVRNRRQHDRGGDPMAVPMGSAAKMVTLLWRFQTSCSVVSCGTRGTSYALRGIPTCFIMCQKSFCVTGAILLHRFQKMTFMFRGKHRTLEVSNLHFAWQPQHFIDVWCCVFFANRIVRAASRGGKMQIAWQALHFATCDSDEN